MKNTRFALLALAAALALSLPAFGAQSYSGVIMDSGCASMGSHAQMEKGHHLPSSSTLTGKIARECTLACVKAGGHFVLYNPSTKTTYKLDPESDAGAYAGERVSVAGTLNGDTIQVQKISKHRM